MKRLCLSLAMLALAGSLASAQQVFIQAAPPPPPPPPGMAAGMPPARDTPTKGTAAIRGRVLATDTGQPIRKALVRANSPELREGRLTTTDADGKYELKELPAGRITLTANKGSFVTLSYGQLRPFEPGKPLEVLDGQTIEKVDFSLPRGSIITGRVVDEFGDPVADAQVAPMRFVNQGGRRLMQPSGRMAMTNDIGEYRLFVLSPGQYYVSATLRPGSAGGGVMMGVQSDDRSGYAPTYYPGTPNVAEAQKLNVGLAQTLNEINVALSPTRLASVSGIAFDAQGRPMTGGMVMTIQRQGEGGFSMNSGGMIRPDGTFQVTSLAPGSYTMQAMNPTGGGGMIDVGAIATADITVAGDDIKDVRLAAVTPSTVTGRIVFNDASAAASLRASTLRIAAPYRNPADFNPFMGGPGKVNDDFTFEMKLRPGGGQLIRLSPMSGGWTLKAVRLNGADVTDTGIEVRANEDLAGVEVEMTNHASDLSGLVTNARGEAVKDYSVVIFAQDRERWGPGSRFMRTGRPDQDGRFKINGLPAGSYYAIAVDYIEPGDATDPEFLDRVRGKALGFSLNDAETKTLDLKVTTGT